LNVFAVVGVPVIAAVLAFRLAHPGKAPLNTVYAKLPRRRWRCLPPA